MKKTLIILLAVITAVLWMTSACAEKFSGDLFEYAKNGLNAMAAGKYEPMVSKLPFTDASPSASEWAKFAKCYSDLSDVQTKYAVAYWNGVCWNVAIPISEPDDGKVEVFILTSNDGKAFSGYRYTTWSQVVNEYSVSSKVYWDEEYYPDVSVATDD